MLDYKIKFKPFPNGQIIRKYTNNEMYGYLVLESDEPHLDPMITDLYLNFIDGDKSKLPKREAILRSKTDLLIKFVDKFKTEVIPGRIKISEYLENEIPAEIQKQFLRDDIPYKDAILPYLKKFLCNTNYKKIDNEDFITLNCNGKKILQFAQYSPQNEEDVIIYNYDLEVQQKLIDIFCDIIKDNEEIKIMQNDSVLIRKIKEEKLFRKKTLFLSEDEENYNVRICVFNYISSNSNLVLNGCDGSFIEVEEIIKENNITKKRIALIFGIGANLKEFKELNERDGYLPGKIILHEYRESQIPNKYLRITPGSVIIRSVNLIKSNLEYTIKKDNLGNFIKYNNEHIVIFYEYEFDEDSCDIFVDIENKGNKDIPLEPGGKRQIPTSQKPQRSHESIKRENRILIPLVLMSLSGVIFLMFKVPTIFTVLSVIFGLLIIFFFAGGFYEAIVSKPKEFDLLRTILVGVVVSIIFGIILFIMEITKLPQDPDMWRHP